VGLIFAGGIGAVAHSDSLFSLSCEAVGLDKLLVKLFGFFPVMFENVLGNL
jgi:hypothetical protein